MRDHQYQSITQTLILSSLSTLTPPQLSHLTTTISTAVHRHNHRLATVLSSQSLFSQTLHHLNSLSLDRKTTLLSHHLLLSLHRLTLCLPTPPPPPPPSLCRLRLHDNDAVLLLLLLCTLHHNDPQLLTNTPQIKWRSILVKFFLETILSISDIGVINGGDLIMYVGNVARCMTLVETTFFGGSDRKKGLEVAASPVTVVALPSVEVRGVVGECVVCREEMSEGRDVCELPCQHLFHWMCILPWLKKRNTCPCCRFQLPSDDVFGEIQRLWGALVDVSGSC